MIVQEVVQGGSTQEIGRLQGGEIFIGREPDGGGIALDRQAISRNHGVFTKIRTHWMYRDLGSTNGSWVNGQQARENEWKLIRPGSVIQLADVILRIESEGEGWNRSQGMGGFASLGGRSLLVFAGDFVDEFLIPEYGRALVIGGAQADLPLPGDIFEHPSLVIERRGDKVVAFGLVKEQQIYVNGQQITELANLDDGDTVRIGNYSVLLNDPTRISVPAAPAAGDSSIHGWNSEDSELPGHTGEGFRQAAGASHRGAGVFGQPSEPASHELDETVALDPDELESRFGADLPPSMRYGGGVFHGDAARAAEDKVILLILLALFMILMGLVAWWVLLA